ncbi:hypothetical protein [Paractinoplanes toevensis]|nr:hypothetical protein [Actinoplanes toevensis]
MREKRRNASLARQAARAEGAVYVAPEITHGLTGFREHGCRCAICKSADKEYKRAANSVIALVPVSADIARGIGAGRRVQALCWLGWSLAEQARRAGLPLAFLSQVAECRPISEQAIQIIALLYRRLSETPAIGVDASQARQEAIERGWVGPLGWDGSDIDDPAAFPITVPQGGPKLLVAWYRTYQLLDGLGLTRREIASVLRSSPNSVRTRRDRARRHPLIRQAAVA